jgi:hypothetical protein
MEGRATAERKTARRILLGIESLAFPWKEIGAVQFPEPEPAEAESRAVCGR